MRVIKSMTIQGWLPAGLVINARVKEPLADRKRVFVVPSPVRTRSITYPPVSSIADESSFAAVDQATATTAIRLASPLLTSAVVISLGIGRGQYAPYMLLQRAYYSGKVEIIAGSDVPMVSFSYPVGAVPTSRTDYALNDPDVVTISGPIQVLWGRYAKSGIVTIGESLTVVEHSLPIRYTPVDGDAAVATWPVKTDIMLGKLQDSEAAVIYGNNTAASKAHAIPVVLPDGYSLPEGISEIAIVGAAGDISDYVYKFASGKPTELGELIEARAASLQSQIAVIENDSLLCVQS